MPAEKSSPEHQHDVVPSQFETKLRRSDVKEEQADAIVDEVNNDEQHKTRAPLNQLKQGRQEGDVILEEDSDSSHSEDPPEFSYVDLQAIRKEVQCPICLGIIKKTRTVMECLHRFCRECIDKSMRMGNNECPACRTHCASRRSLRDDPRYDELIASLYPDIKKFEDEEVAFYEEDEARNKQIQESITQVYIKQSEALGKKRSANKDPAGPSAATSQRKFISSHSRRRSRRKNSSTEYQDSDYNDDVNDCDKHFTPNEHHRDIKPRKAKSRASFGALQSPSATNLSGGSFDNNVEQSKEERGFSPGLTCGTEQLSWGRGGVRSNTRYGNVSDGMSRNAQCMRLAKLVDFFHNLENDDEFAALQTPVKDENIQLRMQNLNATHDHQSMFQASSCGNHKQSQVVDLLQERLHRLDREETFSGAVSL